MDLMPIPAFNFQKGNLGEVEKMLDFFKEPVIILDEHLRVFRVNKLFLQEFGFDESIENKHFFELKILINDTQEICRKVSDVFEANPPVGVVDFETEHYHCRVMYLEYAFNKHLILSLEKKAEKQHELLSYPSFLRQVLYSLPMGVWITNAQGKIIFTNPAAEKTLGAAPLVEQIKDYPVYKSWWPDNGQELQPDEYPIVKTLLTRTTYENVVFYIRRFDGTTGLFSTSAAPILDRKGELKGAVAFCQDITLQQEAQQELKRERELLKTIFESIPVMLSIYDPSINVQHMNKAFYDITGWTEEDIRKGNTMELVYPDEQYRQEVSQYMQSLAPGFRDIKMQAKDGRVIESSWANIKLPDGRQVGIGMNISKRKQAEQALRESQEQFSAAFRMSSDALALIDRENGKIVDVNQAWEKIWGFDRETSIGKNGFDLGMIGASDQQQLYEVLGQQGRISDYQVDLMTASGEKRHAIVDVEVLLPGERELMLVTIQDVTQSKRDKQQLLDLLKENLNQRQFLETIMNCSHAGIAVVSGPELRYTLVNPAYEKLYPTNKIIGKRLRDTFPDNGIEQIVKDVIITSQPYFASGFNQPVEGKTDASWDFQIVPVPQHQAKNISALIMIWDTTLHSRMQKELGRYSQELADANRDLESFSYSVSHDLRTPLLTASSFAAFLKEEYEHLLDQNGLEYISHIHSAIDRMQHLINDMLVLSGVSCQDFELVEVDVTNMVKEIAGRLKQYEPDRKSQIIVQEGIFAEADFGLLKVAIENLIGNAWKFSSQKQISRIEFGCKIIKNQAVYFVKDNGSGFGMKYAEKIQELVFR
jgi:PAS domain S-box-containing protein